MIKYIESSPSGWSTFIGDDTSATRAEFLALAKEISKAKNIPVQDIFTPKPLNDAEQAEFMSKLQILKENLTGNSLLAKSKAGQEQIYRLELSKKRKPGGGFQS